MCAAGDGGGSRAEFKRRGWVEGEEPADRAASSSSSELELV
jgi:hypothetical protein